MSQSRKHPKASTSTKLDVATWWKHGGEPRVQFNHKVFEISRGLSAEYIQQPSVYQSKPARTKGNVQRLIIGTPNVDAGKRDKRTFPPSNATETSNMQV